VLELSSAGRATFTVLADDIDISVFSVVTFEANYSRFDTLQRLFLGFVESVFRVDVRRVRLFCREMVAVLSYPLPLSLRHPTLADVAQAISDKSAGLAFNVPEQPYSSVKIPHFTNCGSGFNALKFMGQAFSIADYVWQQKDDGSIFVGAWADGEFSNNQVPDDLFGDLDHNSATILALPTLRPGQSVNGLRLTRVIFSGNTMALTWA
jgi:hypothetical protein